MGNRKNPILIALFNRAFVLLKRQQVSVLSQSFGLVGKIHRIIFTDDFGEMLVLH
jgi:hypothetical protein